MIFFRNNIFGKITFFILLFLFVYPFKMVGLPVSFRVLFSVFGAAILVLRLLALRTTFFSFRLLHLAIVAIAICIMSVFSTYIFNHAGDPEFVNFWLMPTFCFLSAYFVISFGLAAFPQLDFFLLSKYFIAVVLAQALLSAAMFLAPNIYTALLSIQQMDELDMLKSEESIGSRLLGLGASFMIMGVINCVALLLIAILLKQAPLTKRYRLYLILTYLAIFAIGMMQARTTVIGLLVSLAYLCVSSFRLGIKGVKKAAVIIGNIIVVSLLLVAAVVVMAKDFIEENQQIINYGFEMIKNYQENGKLESASTNQLQDMYVYPEQVKTYLVGRWQIQQCARRYQVRVLHAHRCRLYPVVVLFRAAGIGLVFGVPVFAGQIFVQRAAAQLPVSHLLFFPVCRFVEHEKHHGCQYFVHPVLRTQHHVGEAQAHWQ